MKRLTRIFVYLLVAHSFFLLRTTGQTVGNSTALTGKVLSINGLPISGITITIESRGYLFKTKTDANGYYSTPLPIGSPPGFYKIYTEGYFGRLPYKEKYIPDECQSYFRAATRAYVHLDSADPVNINLILIESGALCSWEDNSEKISYGVFMTVDHGTIFPNIRYESIRETIDSDGLGGMIIQYGDRKEKNGKILYSTYVFDPPPSLFGVPEHPGVVITYNRTTIYANRVEVDRRKKTVKADGNVVIEDGKTQSRAKKVEISPGKDDPIFRFEK